MERHRAPHGARQREVRKPRAHLGTCRSTLLEGLPLPVVGGQRTDQPELVDVYGAHLIRRHWAMVDAPSNRRAIEAQPEHPISNRLSVGLFRRSGTPGGGLRGVRVGAVLAAGQAREEIHRHAALSKPGINCSRSSFDRTRSRKAARNCRLTAWPSPGTAQWTRGSGLELFRDGDELKGHRGCLLYTSDAADDFFWV